MVEIVLAAWLPPVILWLLVRRSANRDLARASVRWFIPATMLWFAPSWLLGGSPVSFDYLFDRVVPWSPLRMHGFVSGNSLLSDGPLQVVPWRETARRAILGGEWPFRNPYAGSGSALWQNPLAAILSPLTLAGLPFSSFAWPLFLEISKLLIALVGMYVFLREEGTGDAGARFGALAFAFSAYSIAFLVFPTVAVAALLPWLLYFIRRIVATRAWRAAAGAAIIIFLAFAAGHVESVLHVSFLAVPYAVWRIVRERVTARPIVMLLAAGVTGVLLSLPILLPFAAFLPRTERYQRFGRERVLAEAPALTAANLTPFFLPAHLLQTRDERWPGQNFNEIATQYAGLTTFVLALAALAAAPKRNAFWGVLLALLFLFAYRIPYVSGGIDRLPVIGLTLHARVRFLMAFLLALLAARGLDALLDGRMPAGWLRALGIGSAVLAAGVVTASWPEYQRYGTANGVIASAAAALVGVAFLAARPRRVAPYLPLLLMVDLYALLGAYNPSVPRSYYYPETPGIEALRQGRPPYRIVGIEGALQPNSAAMLGLEDIGTNDPIAYEPYLKLLDYAGYDRRRYFNRFNRLPARALLDFLGVRYVIGPPDLMTDRMPLAYRGADANVFLNPAALERFFIPREIRIAADPAADFRSSTDARVVHAAEPAELSPAEVRLEGYGMNWRRVRVRTARATFLASSEVALPGWRLARNGTAFPLRQINGPFLGWNVPPGDSEFELTYRPPLLTAGFAGGIAGLAGLGLMFGAERRRRKVPAPE